jgi:hypothetical protein
LLGLQDGFLGFYSEIIVGHIFAGKYLCVWFYRG